MLTVESILNILPPKAAGVFEYHLGRNKTFHPHGGPMNGQTAPLRPPDDGRSSQEENITRLVLALASRDFVQTLQLSMTLSETERMQIQRWFEKRLGTGTRATSQPESVADLAEERAPEAA